MAKKRRPSEPQGLTPQIFSGLNEKRMKKGTGGDKLFLKQGDTYYLQPATNPDEFLEYNNHTFRDSRGWNYVPCAGKTCELCENEDTEISKTSYRFCGNFWNTREKRMQIIEGPKDLAGRLFRKYKRKPSSFTKRVLEVSKLPTQPVSYEVEMGDDDPIDLKGKPLHDLKKSLIADMERYFGESFSSDSTSSSLDDDDDYEDDDEWDEDEEDEDEYEDDDDEEVYDRDELEEMSKSELMSLAKEFGVKPKNRSQTIKDILRKQ